VEKKKGLSKQAYSVAPGEEYVPYIPAEQSMAEFTTFSFLLGIILAVIFGAANAYLGLRVGMTVSASIPAAVVSMGIIRGILKLAITFPRPFIRLRYPYPNSITGAYGAITCGI
jgi:hypothetical protein